MILEIKQRISELETNMENNKVEKYESEHYYVIESNNKIMVQLTNFKGVQMIQFKRPFLYAPYITFRSDSLKESLYLSYQLNEKSIMISNTNFIPVTGLLIIEGINL
jgi:hypothetical protein